MDNNRRPNFLIAAEAIILVAVILIVLLKAAGLFGGIPKKNSVSSDTATEESADSGEQTEKSQSDDSQSTSDTSTDQTQNTDQSNASSDIAISTTASAKAAAMSTEDKISQLFYITPEQLTHVGTMVRAGDQTKTQINSHPVGGLAFAQDNFTDADQAKQMLTNVQQMMNDRIQTNVFISYISGEGENPDTNALNGYGVNTTVSTSADGGSFSIAYFQNASTPLTGKTPSSASDAVNNINNGIDVIYLPSDFETVYDGVVKAVQNGTISADTLNNAVGRILTVKGI